MQPLQKHLNNLVGQLPYIKLELPFVGVAVSFFSGDLEPNKEPNGGTGPASQQRDRLVPKQP